MNEIIYEIYIWGYHWETAIDEVGMAILWHEAKHIGELRKEKVKYQEEKVSCQEIGRMQDRKYAAAEERWAREDLELNK